MELVAYLGSGLCAHVSPARAGNAHQIEEAVSDARPVQPLALGDDVGGGIALVHEGQGLVVPGLDADGEAVVARPLERAQLLVRLQRHVRHPGKTADGLHAGQVFADQLRDLHKPVIVQHKGVGPGEEDPLGLFRLRHTLELGRKAGHGIILPHLGLLEVRLHVLQGRHPKGEGQIIVEGAELASVVGAARRDFQQQGRRLVGRPPDGSRVVHKSTSFEGHHTTSPGNEKYGTFSQYLVFAWRSGYNGPGGGTNAEN